MDERVAAMHPVGRGAVVYTAWGSCALGLCHLSWANRLVGPLRWLLPLPQEPCAGLGGVSFACFLSHCEGDWDLVKGAGEEEPWGHGSLKKDAPPL